MLRAELCAADCVQHFVLVKVLQLGKLCETNFLVKGPTLKEREKCSLRNYVSKHQKVCALGSFGATACNFIITVVFSSFL